MDFAVARAGTTLGAGQGLRITQKWLKVTPTSAFTFTEMAVVMAIAMALMLIGIAYVKSRPRPRCGCDSSNITCISNLRQIGMAYRLWANDNSDLFPAFAPVTNGGWKELLAGPNAGSLCWTNYTLMQNELGQSPAVVLCPADDRQRTRDFNPGTFNNLNVSYFVGPDANPNRPDALLAGDRNLTNLPPAARRAKGFGFSLPDGRGNDVLVDEPLSWTSELHGRSNSRGGGNILLGDGSAQETTSKTLSRTWLQSALDGAEARAGAPASVGIRLIFP